VVDHLPSKCQTLNSNSVLLKTNELTEALNIKRTDVLIERWVKGLIRQLIRQIV
jgi:hypothetical protein